MTREHAPSLLASERSSGSNPVDCLGRIFPDEEARRFDFLERLREHLLDPGFRQSDGFPLGEVEDILDRDQGIIDLTSFSRPTEYMANLVNAIWNTSDEEIPQAVGKG